MTPQERRAYIRANGFCAHCHKRKAGGPNGTPRMCGFCAERNRNNTTIRYYRLHPNKPEAPKIFVYTPKKREPQPERGHVTWLELSSGRSNT